ncbi:fatty acid desaturase family protein [Arthrobacter sp. L77]|uniref:fatty acid desaturase family protein n=1 Tax=Arthrobacter sp. L77 TaxID=1496689 RepID=UPI000A9E0F9D|nr:acyl-CoA desaturase [Arthrobacter sp. L77]
MPNTNVFRVVPVIVGRRMLMVLPRTLPANHSPLHRRREAEAEGAWQMNPVNDALSGVADPEPGASSNQVPPGTERAPRLTRTVRIAAANEVVASYATLLKQVRADGLLERRRPFYIGVFLLLMVALTATGIGFVLIGVHWAQLLIAATLAVILTQLAFLGHEASHHQIFASRRTNEWAGRILAAGFVGISYAWWITKHTRHHNTPNTVGKDPDIAMGTLSFRAEDAAVKTGFSAWFTRRQGYLFFPLLTLEGLNLHVQSFRTLFERKPVSGRWVELALIGVRFGGYLGVLFWFLPPGMACAFLGVQLAVFGVYMGASFAPNHKGMPILANDTTADFLNRQVRTSRNVTGGSFIDSAFGGLNFQIEHHLFPNMPRPNLRRASLIVKDHCRRLGIPYTQVRVLASYRAVISHLNDVGLSARDPFDCPMISRYRRP